MRSSVLLVEAGATVDFVDGVGHTPLQRAVDTRQVEFATYLLAHGANVNVVDRDSYDQTPLHAAARAGNLAAVTALIGAGADVNATLGSGETPLQTARYSAAPDEVVAALQAAGARE